MKKYISRRFKVVGIGFNFYYFVRCIVVGVGGGGNAQWARRSIHLVGVYNNFIEYKII